MAAVIEYRHWMSLWSDYPGAARRLAAEPGVTRVCDLGGGASPLLDLEFIATHRLDYHVVDISAEELAKAPPGYTTVQSDAASPAFAREYGPYDLVLSAFLVEHVTDPAALHASVRAALAPGGRAMHTFPTFYDPAFVLNRWLPERAVEPMLHRLEEGREREGVHAKFPAYYRWCRGPTRRQLRRLESVGFDVVEYVGYFGHGYLSSIAPLDRLVQRVAGGLVRRPVAALTSYASVLLRRRD